MRADAGVPECNAVEQHGYKAAFPLPRKSDPTAGHDVTPNLSMVHLYKSENQYGHLHCSLYFRIVSAQMVSYRRLAFSTTV